MKCNINNIFVGIVYNLELGAQIVLKDIKDILNDQEYNPFGRVFDRPCFFAIREGCRRQLFQIIGIFPEVLQHPGLSHAVMDH